MESSTFNLQREAPSEGSASVLGIGTAVPPTVHLQSEYPDFFFNITNSNDKADLKKKFTRICENSGIKKRHFYMTEERLLANPSIPTYLDPSLNIRQEIAIAQIPRFAQEAAQKAIKEWGRPKSEITHVVFATTSGVNMPGADHTISKLLGLRPNVRRVMMYQIGCYGGASVMRVGKDLAENTKGARVLVIASEITCLTFRAPSETHVDGLVGSALFGDGAAAIILGSDPRPGVERPIFEIKWAGETVIPESANAIEGRLTEAGLVFHLLQDVPGLISKNIEKFLNEARQAVGSPEWNKMFWAVHPGGPAILDQVEATLGLEKTKMGASRDTLSEYGNMSSATVLFVLDRIRQRSIENGSKNSGEGNDYGFLIGFGPGLTLEVLTLKSLATQLLLRTPIMDTLTNEASLPKYNATDEVTWFISVTKEPSWPQERFEHEFCNVHANMVSKTAEMVSALRGYTQLSVSEAVVEENCHPQWDYVACITWQSPLAIWTGFQNPGYKATAGKHIFCRLDQVGSVAKKVGSLPSTGFKAATTRALIFHPRAADTDESSQQWLQRRLEQVEEVSTKDHQPCTYNLFEDVTPKDPDFFLDTQFAKGTWHNFKAIEEFGFDSERGALDFLEKNRNLIVGDGSESPKPLVVVGDARVVV